MTKLYSILIHSLLLTALFAASVGAQTRSECLSQALTAKQACNDDVDAWTSNHGGAIGYQWQTCLHIADDDKYSCRYACTWNSSDVIWCQNNCDDAAVSAVNACNDAHSAAEASLTADAQAAKRSCDSQYNDAVSACPLE